MLATKSTPPVSVRLEEETYEQLEEMLTRYPIFTRSQMVSAAVKYWMAEAFKCGVDANLQPLKTRGKA